MLIWISESRIPAFCDFGFGAVCNHVREAFGMRGVLPFNDGQWWLPCKGSHEELRGSNPRSLVADPDSRNFPGGRTWKRECMVGGFPDTPPCVCFPLFYLNLSGKSLRRTPRQQENVNSKLTRNEHLWIGRHCLWVNSFQFLNSLPWDRTSLVLIPWPPPSDLLLPSPIFLSPLSRFSSSC